MTPVEETLLSIMGAAVFGRDTLLAHEHLEADRRGEAARAFPAHELDSRHDAKSIIAA
jgi:hypothetical protein